MQANNIIEKSDILSRDEYKIKRKNLREKKQKLRRRKDYMKVFGLDN